jgi:hypothetical protein
MTERKEVVVSLFWEASVVFRIASKWYARGIYLRVKRAMLDAAYKFTPKRHSEDTGRTLHGVFLWTLLLLLFVFASSGTIEAANRVSRPTISIGPGSQFAIADFDGDGHPDLASIQAGQDNAVADSYWIEVNLSSVGREFLRLTGPTGGLRIEARDVNGDHSIDLVLFTAWLRQPVAIFLNDGHGNFSRVATSKFPEAFRQSNEKLVSVFVHEAEAAGALLPSRDRICLDARGLPQDESLTASMTTPSSPNILRRSLISRAGRAPPSNTFYA